MKEDKLHHTTLEQRLREAAENFEMQPSEAVWKHVEAALPSKGKKVFLWRWAAVAAVFLLLGGLGWYFMNKPAIRKRSNDQPSSIAFTDSSRHHEEGKPFRPDSETIKPPAPVHPDVAGSTAATSRPAHEEEDTDAQNNSPSLIALQADESKGEPAHKTTATGQNLTGPNSALPFLQNIARQPLNNHSGRIVAPLRYSDVMVRLMLESARPTEPLLAQNNPSQTEERKVTVGLFFTPGISYRTLKTGSASSGQQRYASPNMGATLRPNNEEASLMQVNMQQKPLQQKQSWGWGSGVRVALHLPKNWIVQTGLSLRQTNYEITAYKQDPAYVYSNGSSTMAAAPMANSTFARYASRVPSGNRATTLENRYLSTELPLLIGRRFGSPDKFSFTVFTGAGLTYLLHAHSIMYAPQSQRYFSDKDYLHPFNSSLILEANMNIPLSKNLGFSIGPAFQYQLFSSYKNYDPVKEHPYLIGLKTALQIK